MYRTCFLILATIPFIATQDISIPNIGDIPLQAVPFRGDKLYAVAAFAKVNWFHAQQLCSYYGMNLASINSKQDNYQLWKYLTLNGLNDKSYWVGGTDLAEQDGWFWLSNGRPFSYSDWRNGEPNNVGGNEHCLELSASGKWNDIDCRQKKYFICENRCPLESYNVPLNKKK